jgi:pimeloyl-ACP methyl ester carboxylesterase
MSPLFLLLSAIVVGLAAGTYAAFWRALRRADNRLTGRRKTIQTAAGTMEFADVGTGAPVLCIHGAAGGFDQTLDMTGALANKGYRLIAPSRFGYLQSGAPENLTVAMQADAYVELLDHLGIAQVAVAGISAGAWSCLEFAIRHPDRCRALILLVPANALPQGVKIHGGAVARAIFNSDFIAWIFLKLTPLPPDLLAEVMLGTDPLVLRTAEPAEKARAREILDHLLPVSRRTGGMNFDIQTAAAPPPLAIERIVCPVLAISAEDDTFGTALRARNIVSQVRNERTIVFPTGGHALIGRHADALREVTSFLRGLTQ